MLKASVAGPAETYGALRRFGSLDGLRAFAILWVIWQHCANTTGGPDPFTNAGASGVGLFFVLSGYLITTLLLREWRSNGSVDLSAFYWRRTLRILPLYYATIAVYCVLVAVLERNSAAGRDFFANLPFFLTYTNNWFVDLAVNADGERRSIFVFAWTLATEEQFYLLWPPLLVLLTPRRAYWILAGLAAVDIAISASFSGLETPHDTGTRLLKVITSFSSEIAFGCVLGGVLHHSRGLEVAWKFLGQRWSIWLASAASIWVLFAWEQPSTGWRVTQALVFTMLIGAAVITPRHGLSWLLDCPLIARIGIVSYGMYLLHMLAIHATKQGFGLMGWSPVEAPWMFLIGSIALAYAAAEISFRWFELPILSLKSRPAWFGLGRRLSAIPQRHAPAVPHSSAQARQVGSLTDMPSRLGGVQ